MVDDSITVRKVTSRLLERHNMQVITARDGVDAVTQLQEVRPDVMLLDIEMPRMDGITFLRKIMQERPTPVVICSTLTARLRCGEVRISTGDFLNIYGFSFIHHKGHKEHK